MVMPESWDNGDGRTRYDPVLAAVCHAIEVKPIPPMPRGMTEYEQRATDAMMRGEYREWVKENRPPPDTDEFHKWCEEVDATPLASSRRAWWPDVGTYVRDATHVVYLDGAPVDVWTATEEEQ